MLSLKDIKKDYVVGDSTVSALKGVSIDFRENEFVSILGPSGCGKTTLLNIIGGLDRYTSGDLNINGKSTKDFKDCDWDSYRNHSIGFVFQSYNLFPHFTLLKNVMDAPVQVQKRPAAEVREEAMALLGKMGLADRADAYPCQLSGGQQQRAAIARALCMKPELLFFDEPTSALDPELTGEVLRVLRDLADRRTTMIIVTHEMNFARDVADRILFMDGGVVVEQGPARQLIEHPQEERTRRFLAHYSE